MFYQTVISFPIPMVFFYSFSYDRMNDRFSNAPVSSKDYLQLHQFINVIIKQWYQILNTRSLVKLDVHLFEAILDN